MRPGGERVPYVGKDAGKEEGNCRRDLLQESDFTSADGAPKRPHRAPRRSGASSRATIDPPPTTTTPLLPTHAHLFNYAPSEVLIEAELPKSTLFGGVARRRPSHGIPKDVRRPAARVVAKGCAAAEN